MRQQYPKNTPNLHIYVYLRVLRIFSVQQQISLFSK